MIKKTKSISFSTIRRKIHLVFQSQKKISNCHAALNFMPADLKIWLGCDSDNFHRAFCHHRMILKLLLSGSASSCIDGIRYHLTKGDAVLYFPMQTHSTETEEKGEFEYLAISFVAGMGNYDALLPLRNHVFVPDPSNQFLVQIADAWNAGDSIHAACLLAEMLAKAAAEVKGNINTGDSLFLSVTEYIRKNCRKELSVKTIADAFQVSPQTIRRIFHRNVSGLTPGELIRRQRIVYAGELLRCTDLKIAAIAEQCGFSSAFAFSRTFRNMQGYSPQMYRKSLSK